MGVLSIAPEFLLRFSFFLDDFGMFIIVRIVDFSPQCCHLYDADDGPVTIEALLRNSHLNGT